MQSATRSHTAPNQAAALVSSPTKLFKAFTSSRLRITSRLLASATSQRSTSLQAMKEVNSTTEAPTRRATQVGLYSFFSESDLTPHLPQLEDSSTATLLVLVNNITNGPALFLTQSFASEPVSVLRPHRFATTSTISWVVTGCLHDHLSPINIF